MKNQTKVLVIGATGKTGMPLVEQAIRAGLGVRAVIRREDERSERLRQAGAETITGDVHDLRSVREMVEGVDRIYFAYPPHLERLVEATSNVAIAAKDTGVRGVVNMSQLTARDGARSPLTQQHWVSETILDHAHVGAIHIRPSYFMENLLLFNAQTIASQGTIFLPYGDRGHAPIAARDIARSTVSLLKKPEEYAGQRLFLTGPDLLSIAEIADTVSSELDKPVQYVDLPVDQWHEILTKQVGIPEYLANHLQQVAIDHQEGLFERRTSAVEDLTGSAPQSLREFVKEHLAQFRGEKRVSLGV